MAARRLAAALVFVGLGACGGAAGTTSAPADSTAGTIAGSVKGTSWSTLSNAYWIGKNAPGGPAVSVFLFEARVACADIVNLNWDKTATGARQILELSFTEQATRA